MHLLSQYPTKKNNMLQKLFSLDNQSTTVQIVLFLVTYFVVYRNTLTMSLSNEVSQIYKLNLTLNHTIENSIITKNSRKQKIQSHFFVIGNGAGFPEN